MDILLKYRIKIGGFNDENDETKVGGMIEHFEFLENKVESCYRETTNVLENPKEEYKKNVVKFKV